jgi:hypothetical protein
VRKQGTVANVNTFGVNDPNSPVGTVISDASLQSRLGNPTNASADGSSSANGVDIISGTNYVTCQLP